MSLPLKESESLRFHGLSERSPGFGVELFSMIGHRFLLLPNALGWMMGTVGTRQSGSVHVEHEMRTYL